MQTRSTNRQNATESSIALQLGASGIFLKHNSPVTLGKAIRLVASGEMWVDQRVIHLMADGVHQREELGIRRMLTEREQQVLRGIFEGLTNKEIAAQIGVSEGAVKATSQQLFQTTRADEKPIGADRLGGFAGGAEIVRAGGFATSPAGPPFLFQTAEINGRTSKIEEEPYVHLRSQLDT